MKQLQVVKTEEQSKQERSDREKNLVRWIVQDLQKRGIDASVVARAHMIPLEEVKR